VGILHETTYNVWLDLQKPITLLWRTRMNKPLVLLITALLFSSPCWSGETPATSDKPSLFTSQTMKLSAVVEAINHETRELTLRGPEGNSATFVVSEEAQNLDQVNVGDIVMTEYVQSMSIEVFANDGSAPAVGALSAEGRAAKGESPALTAIDALVVTATVEEINLEDNTFKLKGPSGEVRQYEARNPENLKKAEVGDLVVITYTDSVAITVEKTDTE
jgi:hypothetical protein